MNKVSIVRIINRWKNDRQGVTAIEFAMVAPVFLTMFISAVVFGFVLFSNNALEETAGEAARCLAINSNSCDGTIVDCQGSAEQCLVVQLAGRRGVADLPVNAVSINPALSINGVLFTEVRIEYPLSIVFLSFELSVAGTYPNGLA